MELTKNETVPLAISVEISPFQIIEHVSNKIDQALELPPGDTAGPQPHPEHLAAIAINALSDFGLLDGSYFAVVQAARKCLEQY